MFRLLMIPRITNTSIWISDGAGESPLVSKSVIFSTLLDWCHPSTGSDTQDSETRATHQALTIVSVRYKPIRIVTFKLFTLLEKLPRLFLAAGRGSAIPSGAFQFMSGYEIAPATTVALSPAQTLSKKHAELILVGTRTNRLAWSVRQTNVEPPSFARSPSSNTHTSSKLVDTESRTLQLSMCRLIIDSWCSSHHYPDFFQSRGYSKHPID